MPGDPDAWPPLLRGLIAMAQWHDPTAHEHDVLAFLDDATRRARALLVRGGTTLASLVGGAGMEGGSQAVRCIGPPRNTQRWTWTSPRRGYRR